MHFNFVINDLLIAPVAVEPVARVDGAADRQGLEGQDEGSPVLAETERAYVAVEEGGDHVALCEGRHAEAVALPACEHALVALVEPGCADVLSVVAHPGGEGGLEAAQAVGDADADAVAVAGVVVCDGGLRKTNLDTKEIVST